MCVLKPQEQYMYMVLAALQPGRPWSERPAGDRSLKGGIRSGFGQVLYLLQRGEAGRDRDRLRPERGQVVGCRVGVDEFRYGVMRLGATMVPSWTYRLYWDPR